MNPHQCNFRVPSVEAMKASSSHYLYPAALLFERQATKPLCQVFLLWPLQRLANKCGSSFAFFSIILVSDSQETKTPGHLKFGGHVVAFGFGGTMLGLLKDRLVSTVTIHSNYFTIQMFFNKKWKTAWLSQVKGKTGIVCVRGSLAK